MRLVYGGELDDWMDVFVSLYIQRWKLWRFVSFNTQMHCGVDLKASLPMFLMHNG